MPISSVSCFSATGSDDAATASRIANPRSRLWIVGVSCVGFPLMIGAQRPSQNTTPLRFDLPPGAHIARGHSKMLSQMQRSLRIVHSVESPDPNNRAPVGQADEGESQGLREADVRGGSLAAGGRWSGLALSPGVAAQSVVLKDLVPNGWLIGARSIRTRVTAATAWPLISSPGSSTRSALRTC